jgi:hypothetical protein
MRFLQGVGRDAVDSTIRIVARGLHRYRGGVIAVGL